MKTKGRRYCDEDFDPEVIRDWRIAQAIMVGVAFGIVLLAKLGQHLGIL